MSSIRPSAKRSYVKNNWLLSLGDLLTLLLGFFVSIVSLGPLNPANKSYYKPNQSQALSPEVKHPENNNAAARADGIGFAKLNVGDEAPKSTQEASDTNKLSVWLIESDFTGTGWELGESARQRLKNAVLQAGYQLKGLGIEGCTESPQMLGESAWAGSISRILSARSQLIDAGVDKRQVNYRALGPNCSELRDSAAAQKAKSENAVMRIALELEKSNG